MRRKYTLITALLLITANLFAGNGAFAHDDVESVYPESGSTVEAGMIDLNIYFSQDVLTTDGTNGFEVVVTDANGEKLPVGCINPMGPSLNARAAIGSAGEYTVSWRSVSADGHPLEGNYKFNVSGTAELDPAMIDACPRAVIAPAPNDDPSAIAYSTGAEVLTNDNTAAEIGMLVLAVVIILGAAIWVTTKRKRAKD